MQRDIAKLNRAWLQFVEGLMCLHFADVDGKIRRRHLLIHHPLQAAVLAGRVEHEPVCGVVIKRPKKWDALDVIPMEVRNKNVRSDGAIFEFAMQLLSQRAKTSTAIEDENAVPNSHFNAGSITAITQVFRLRSWYGPSNSPELDAHRFRRDNLSSCNVRVDPSILSLVTETGVAGR